MNSPTGTTLLIGDWRVDQNSGQISRGAEAVRVEARTMRLLLYLAGRAGEVVSIDELLEHVWSGVVVTSDSVYQAVASLRRMLGDDSKKPTYIATVPRLGYRMVARVGPWPDPAGVAPAGMVELATEDSSVATKGSPQPSGRRVSSVRFWIGGTVAMLALFVGLAVYFQAGNMNPTSAAATAPILQSSIAVLPFLDLTEEMNEEPLADGMTEELIDKLAKIPGIRIPALRSSFHYKDRRVAVADVAKGLGVTYLLDGSLRKSGSRLRVSARLIRADSGFVVWSQTYDRELTDRLMVQDDIAGEVVRALSAPGAGA